ncbi:hypothetical protein ABMA28_001909 [Loxostege sticticalis]|uniref:Ubiquitin-like-conjugating enzyme ATG10 n=1 Tax=Loxostege sticticalis TaxID=481309 RepID=A0ABD0T1Q0_LOXSC
MEQNSTLSVEDFVVAATSFYEISNRLADGWKLIKDENETHKTYIKKHTFLQVERDGVQSLLKTELVIFFNLSYGVPAFSFNIWNSSGVLLTLEEIRHMSFVTLNQKEFYSVITQQEHPIFLRPYFIVHPCHTAELLSALREGSKNIIVTFLGLITPLLKLDLSMEYGL